MARVPSDGPFIMKKIGKLLAAVLFAASIAGNGPALASQGALVIPTAGTLSGLTAMSDVNAALDALTTCNSGASQPLNSAGAPSIGQFWCSTATSGYLILKQYDGTSWQEVGRQDTTNHLWVPPVGGGVATLTSGSTVDLGSVPQAYVNVTGTTTITAFGASAQPGSWHTIKFAGILTLTHNGTSLILPNAGNNITTAVGDTALAIYLGGANWLVANYTTASGAALQAQSVGSAALLASAQGMNAPLNLRISATVGSSALTVAIKTAANADATSGTPVLIPFRDATLANGDPVIGSLQAALSITIASTNTLGTLNGVPFRLWVIGDYNGGTLAVGLFNASTATQIFGLSEGDLISTAASTNGGNSAGTHYANVSTITNTPYRILGYLEWGSGLATAGTWASAPTKIVLFGPGIKKPGDVVSGPIYVSGAAGATVSNSTPVTTSLTITTTLTSPVNLVKITAVGNVGGTASENCVTTIDYNGSPVSPAMSVTSPAGSQSGTVAGLLLYKPGSAASSVWALYFALTAGSGTITFGGGSIIFEEIMGALDEPANDNGSSELRMVG